jgi:hypothetical protein
MLGHWILWSRGSLDSARLHFSAALASDSARAFVRTLQLAAFSNLSTPDGDREVLRVAAEMRERNETIPPLGQGRIWTMHSRCFGVGPTDCDVAGFRGSLSPAAHLAAFEWALANSGYPAGQGLQYDYVLARLEEEAGQLDKARSAFETLRSRVPSYDDRLRAKVAAAQRRLLRRP